MVWIMFLLGSSGRDMMFLMMAVSSGPGTGTECSPEGMFSLSSFFSLANEAPYRVRNSSSLTDKAAARRHNAVNPRPSGNLPL